MTNDDLDRNPSSENGSETREGGDGASPEMDRLPPPAFPPGYRRSAASAGGVGVEESGEAEEEEEEELPTDAFISPDEPIRKEARGIPDDAFISPDDPFVPADHEDEETDVENSAEVTGVGEDRAAFSSKAGRRGDKPSIHELPYLLDRVAEQIQSSGDQALRVHHDMGHFEASLKSFLKGYLEGAAE